jgi:tetratricopeptide (TPR) repeat protein
VKFNYDGDWAGAATGFERAIHLNHSYATAYQRYSLYLMAMGRTQGSFDQINKTRELDPLSISINFSLGWRLYMARQYDRALEQLRNTLEMDPSYELPHLVAGQAYEQKGQYELAIAELRKAVDLSHGTPMMISALACLRALRQQDRSGEVAGPVDSRIQRAVRLAVLHRNCLCRTRRQRGSDQLVRTGLPDRSNGLVFLQAEPQLDSLRSNPRFMALQKKLGFTELSEASPTSPPRS